MARSSPKIPLGEPHSASLHDDMSESQKPAAMDEELAIV